MQIPTHREDLAKGFKLSFHFVENPYFTNTEITKEILISWERIFLAWCKFRSYTRWVRKNQL